jgi:uncharacterized protein involved in type VI secretion and phage assembly
MYGIGERLRFNCDGSDCVRINWEWDSGISNDRSDSSWIRVSDVKLWVEMMR